MLPSAWAQVGSGSRGDHVINWCIPKLVTDDDCDLYAWVSAGLVLGLGLVLGSGGQVRAGVEARDLVNLRLRARGKAK